MIENIKVLHDRLHVFFTNQKQEEYPIIWLRDHARDEINWDSRTSQRKIFTASLDSNVQIKNADGRGGEGQSCSARLTSKR